jgi:ApeA N-terminal domain 1
MEAGSHPRLELDGTLTPLMRETSRRELPDGREVRTSSPVPPEELVGQSLTVHGTLDETGEPVTLPSAFTAGWTMRGNGTQTHRLQAFYALLGDHVDGAAALFTRIRVRIRHLDAWASLPGFMINPGSTDGSWTLTYEPPKIPPATMASGARICLEQAATVRTPSPEGGRLERSLWLDVLDIPPATHRDLDRKLVKPLMNLLSFAVGKECPLVEMTISAGPDDPWLTVQSAAMKAAAEDVIPLPQILLPMTEIGMDGVAAWLDSTGRLGPLPSVVARVVNSQDDTLEAQLLELTTTAEGLHVLLMEPGRMHYAERLLGLATAAEEAVPGATGNTVEWVRRVKTARNDFAHKLEHGFLDDDNAEEWAILLLSLRWLLTGTLLLQTRVSPATLGKRMATYEAYQLFLAQARVWLPSVYANTGS